MEQGFCCRQQKVARKELNAFLGLFANMSLPNNNENNRKMLLNHNEMFPSGVMTNRYFHCSAYILCNISCASTVCHKVKSIDTNICPARSITCINTDFNGFFLLVYKFFHIELKIMQNLSYKIKCFGCILYSNCRNYIVFNTLVSRTWKYHIMAQYLGRRNLFTKTIAAEIRTN